ncbi:MAG: hypothetical protein P8076_00795 [Gammaproteobacteria bacterium]
MTRIELVYDRDCPNVAAARRQLRHAIAEAGRVPAWTEWDTRSAETPDRVRGFGSPTILVDGRDVTGEAPVATDACCRIYADGNAGERGVPPKASIVAALRAAGSGRPLP